MTHPKPALLWHEGRRRNPASTRRYRRLCIIICKEAHMDPAMWHHIIYPDISILEKLIRPGLVYVFLIVGLRLAGKRELAQLNAFDLVVLLTLSNTVQNAIIGNDNSVSGGLIGATALLLVNYVVVRFLYSHETLDRVIEGEPTILMDRG